jgi:hypothetical protein
MSSIEYCNPRVGYGYENRRFKETEIVFSKISIKNKRSRTDELTINDVLRSFNGKDDDSSEDDNVDQFNEIYDNMKKKFVYPNDADILKWWQDH